VSLILIYDLKLKRRAGESDETAFSAFAFEA
jgi:hypothetical protein